MIREEATNLTELLFDALLISVVAIKLPSHAREDTHKAAPDESEAQSERV